jgi:hypothetical protein
MKIKRNKRRGNYREKKQKEGGGGQTTLFHAGLRKMNAKLQTTANLQKLLEFINSLKPKLA